MFKHDLLKDLHSQFVAAQQALADWEKWAEKQRISNRDAEQQALAKIQNEYDKTIDSARRKFEEDLVRIDRETGQDLEDVRNHYESSWKEVNWDLETMAKSFGYPEVGWDHPSWTNYKPADVGKIPRVIRIGILRATNTHNQISLPALVPIIGSRSVVIKASGAAKEQAIRALQSLMLRLFLTLPPGKLKFLMIDPVGGGSNMAAFLNIRSDEVKKKIIIGDRIWTEASHIEQRLADLSAHMETVIQQYLTNKFPTMEAYNEAVGEVAEAYRLLCIANFPVNFTEAAARRLISIAANGSKTGVYTLVMVDTEQAPPHGFLLTDLERVSAVIEHTNDGFIWKEDEVFSKCSIELDSPPSREQFNAFVEQVGQETETAFKVEIPFEKVAPSREAWWEGDASTGFRVPIGKQGAKNLLFDLGKGTAQHALVVGKTGSGKSTLLHSLIMNLAFTYSPDELSLYLIDFKKGVEFRDYAHYQLPHARVVAIQSEREFGFSVLKELDRELQERGDRFTSIGVNNLQAYREKCTGEKMPRILLLVDEFQEFFTEDDHLARHVAGILDRLVRQGRALGIHVLLATQSLNSSYSVSKGTIDQMGVRIALQCSEADSRLILGDDNDAARGLDRPGAAIYNDANGLVEGNKRFQVVLLTNDELKSYLQTVQEYARSVEWFSLKPQIVFDGLELARLEANYLLKGALESTTWQRPGEPVSAWLGDPIAIKTPTAAVFRRQSRSNLLILGQNEEAGVPMLLAAVISLAAQQFSHNASFYVLDLSNVDSSWYPLFGNLSEALPHRIETRRRREVHRTIQEMDGFLKERLALENVLSGDSIFLVISGLQHAKDLRSDDSYDQTELQKQFSAILRDGSEVGIHTLLWCDTYLSLERILDRKNIALFDLKVALQMAANDSNKLIDSDAATKLGPCRALFLDEDRTGQLEKFRPYNFPSSDWIRDVGARLRSKTASTSS